MVKVSGNLDLETSVRSQIQYGPETVAEFAEHPSRAATQYLVPDESGGNAGPDTPPSFSWGQTKSWDASNVDINPQVPLAPGGSETFLNYGGVTDATLVVSSDAATTASFNIGTGGTQSFAMFRAAGETYTVKFEWNGQVGKASGGINFVGTNGNPVTWTAENPAAISTSGNNFSWVSGQTTKWIQLSFVSDAATTIELAGTGGGWTLDMTDYGGPVTPGSALYNVAFQTDGVTESYVAVNASDPTDIIEGVMPLPVTYVEQISASDMTSTVIDSSAGAVAEVLPAATGAGAIVFFANEDVTNTATLAPAAGEQLNGVADATFLFSNYAAGTQFRADDIAAGQWVISVVGATDTADPVKTAALTELTSTSHTLVTGTTPVSTEVAINSIRYIDEGPSFRRVYLDLYSFQDDATELQLGTGVLPATASIKAAYATHGPGSNAENSANQRPSIYITGTNEITINRDDSAQSGITPIGIVLLLEDTADSFAGSELVLAGMVTPENLHFARIGTGDGVGGVAAVATSIGSGYDVPDLADVDLVDVFDPEGIVSTADNSFTIVKAGRYRIEAQYRPTPASSSAIMRIAVDGVFVWAAYSDQTATEAVGININWTGDLAAGAKVEFAVLSSFQNLQGFMATITEQPTGTVVMPDALVPTALSDIQVSLAATTNNSALTHYGFDTLISSNGGELTLSGTGSIQNLQPGKRYKLTANLQLLPPTSGNAEFRFVDLTTSSQIGRSFEATTPTFTVNASSQVGEAWFTPTQVTEVGVEHVAGSVGEISNRSTFSVEEQPEYSVVAWEPGQVEATALSRGTVLIDDTGTVTSPVVWIDIPTAAVTLPNVGTYELSYALSLSPTGAGQGFSLRWADSAGNPVPESANFANTGSSSNSKIVSSKTRVATTAANEEYRLQWRTTTDGSRILGADVVPGTAESRVMWDQLPTTEVVQPGSVVPTATGFLTATLGANETPSSGDHVRLSAVTQDTSGGAITLDTTTAYTTANGVDSIGRFTLQPGQYELTGVLSSRSATAGNYWDIAIYDADTGVALAGPVRNVTVQDGAINVTRPTDFRDLYFNIPAPTRVELRYVAVAVTTVAHSPTIPSYITIRQLVEATVVDPGAIAVDDQAASGYFDLGTMRMQWGVVPGTASLGDIVFPAPFADTGYSFVANVEAATTNDLFVVQHSVKTTTQVHYDKVFHGPGIDDAPSGAITEPFSWIAIGDKP